MTRNEAVNVLKQYIIEDVVAEDTKEYNKALRMAIEALQIELIRCGECKHQDECEEVVLFEINDEEVMGHRLYWCSYAERNEE